MTSMHFEELFTMSGHLNGSAKALEFGTTISERVQPQGGNHESGR